MRRIGLHIGLTVIASVIQCHFLYCQDPIYSQYYNAPLQLNPAFAGNSNSPIIAINYRNQWPLWPQAYNTYSVSYDQYFEDYNSGVGMSLLADDAGNGIMKTIRASGIYSYRILINNDLQMKFGAEFSITQTRLDWDQLLFFDQLDPGNTTPGGTVIPSQEIRPNDLTNNYIDFSTGLLLFSSRYYAGISLKHLNTPSNLFIDDPAQSYSNVPLRISLHAGAQFDLENSNNYNDRAFISPNVMFVKQSELSQLNVGALSAIGPFIGGLWYRHAFNNPDAVIVSAGMRYGIMKITYSFDLTISQLGFTNTGGSHEIGIVLNFDRSDPRKKNYNDCFSIFR